MATLFGFWAGYLCLRLRGSYLSLATLAFPLIALGLLFAFPDFSGGELGISGLRRLTPSATGNYYVAAVSMLFVVFGLWTLADSKFGLVLHAIRDDEVAARASGINTPRYKLIAFAVSAAAAGFAGALFAHYLRVAGPSTLEVALSFQVVIWGIFGGVATIYGPVAAVFILYPLTEWLGSFRALGELRLLPFAVVGLLGLLFLPRGLAPPPWMRRIAANSSSRMRGARPSEGSSMARSLASYIRARAVASICCSPPDSVPAIWSLRSASRGNRPNERSRRRRVSRLLFDRKAPAMRFSSTVNSRKGRLRSGQCTSPSRRISCAGRPSMRSAPNRTSPARTMSPPAPRFIRASKRTSPEMARSRVDLPAPLGPTMPTSSPSSTASDTPLRICALS